MGCDVGGTWGDHIDSIISKDYASGKGTPHGSGGGIGSGQPRPPSPASSISAPLSLSISPKNQAPSAQRREEEAYSWKLRKALQHKEQQQMINHSHPDERHIMRVVSESNHSSRPPSVPSAKELRYPPASEDASDTSGGKLSGGSSHQNANVDFNSRRGGAPGISPLDYVQNRIKEAMRTEKSDEKAEDHSGSVESGSQGPGVSPPTSKTSANSGLPINNGGSSTSPGGVKHTLGNSRMEGSHGSAAASGHPDSER